MRHVLQMFALAFCFSFSLSLCRNSGLLPFFFIFFANYPPLFSARTLFNLGRFVATRMVGKSLLTCCSAWCCCCFLLRFCSFVCAEERVRRLLLVSLRTHLSSNWQRSSKSHQRNKKFCPHPNTHTHTRFFLFLCLSHHLILCIPHWFDLRMCRDPLVLGHHRLQFQHPRRM